MDEGAHQMVMPLGFQMRGVPASSPVRGEHLGSLLPSQRASTEHILKQLLALCFLLTQSAVAAVKKKKKEKKKSCW